MTPVPAHPKIYHITHVRNLPAIVEAGVLWSDAKRVELSLACDVVGMSHIKSRRLHDLEVGCHAGTKVGDYTPFYFCPRSIMLYILHRGNHPDLNYTEGQQPIVHLQADLKSVVEWADSIGRRWAFSDRNAGAFYAAFYKHLDDLHQLEWPAIEAQQWSEPRIKEAKQAEFLVADSLPWGLIERVGVHNDGIQSQVLEAIAEADHQPDVIVRNDWYY